ncbi:hypothetical protein [Deferrisoma palaeochoriense]
MAVGAEFCPRRLAAPGELAPYLRRWKSQGLGVQFVTPAVREGAFEAVWAWLRAALEVAPGAEVAFNDWGLWERARAEGLAFRGVAGRLLSRQRRGPRVLGMVAAAAPREARELRGSVWDEPEGVRLLEEFGAVGVELDLILPGLRVPALPGGVTLRVHAPWIPVTVALACPWTEAPLACDRPCRAAEPACLRNDEDPHPLWSRGNTLFLRRESEPPAAYLARLGAERLLWSPEIPG